MAGNLRSTAADHGESNVHVVVVSTLCRRGWTGTRHDEMSSKVKVLEKAEQKCNRSI